MSNDSNSTYTNSSCQVYNVSNRTNRMYASEPVWTSALRAEGIALWMRRACTSLAFCARPRASHRERAWASAARPMARRDTCYNITVLLPLFSLFSTILILILPFCLVCFSFSNKFQKRITRLFICLLIATFKVFNVIY